MTAPARSQLDITTYRFEDAPKNKEQLLKEYHITGTGAARCAIILKQNGEKIKEEEHLLLKNILSALNLDIDDVLLINLEKAQEIYFSSLRRYFAIDNIVCFGAAPQDLKLNIDISRYDVVNFDGVKFLFTDVLSKFMNSKELKMNLWQKLQEQFSLKK